MSDLVWRIIPCNVTCELDEFSSTHRTLRAAQLELSRLRSRIGKHDEQRFVLIGEANTMKTRCER